MTRGRKAQNGKEQSRRTREHVLERAWKKRERGGYWGNDKHLAPADIEAQGPHLEALSRALNDKTKTRDVEKQGM